MPRRATQARLEFYHPKTGAFRYAIENDVRKIQIEENARDEADDAGFDIANLNAVHTGQFFEGDEVRVKVKQDTDAGLVHLWTGVVDSISSKRKSNAFADLPVRAQDFVYYKLAGIYVIDLYENMDAGAVVRDLIQRYAPGITATSATVENVGTTVETIAFNGVSLLEAIRELSELSDAEWHGDKDKVLHFYPKATKASGASVDATKVRRGSFSIETSMASFGNVITVRGGSRAVQDQANPEPFSAFQVLDPAGVAGVVRVKQRVFVSKSSIARVEVWTDPTGHTGDLRIRIQADNAAGTAPVDETNADADLAQRVLSHEFLAVGGFTTFIMPEHIAPPGGHVWLIAECATDGETQRVGMDATGPDLVYKTHFEVPVIVTRRDDTSVTKYGERHLPPISNKNIASESEADLIANMELARNAVPARAGSYQVASFADATLVSAPVGKTVSATFPDDGVTAGTPLIIMRKTHDWNADEGGIYRLTHEFADAERVLRLEDMLLRIARDLQRVKDSVFGRGKDILVDSVRSVDETLVLSDTVSATEQTGGGVVGTARVGFTIVG